MYNIENFLDSINVSVYYLSENNSNFDQYDQFVVVCAFTIIIIMCAHERMPMSQSQIKKYFQLFLVVLAAGSIYPLIFLKQGYQESMLQVGLRKFQPMSMSLSFSDYGDSSQSSHSGVLT